MNHRCVLFLALSVINSFVGAADRRSPTPVSGLSTPLSATPAPGAPMHIAAPPQLGMGGPQAAAPLHEVDREDSFGADRGCCRLFYMCGDCLERYRDKFPASLVVDYGRLCAFATCGRTAAGQAEDDRYAAMHNDDPPSGGFLCGQLCVEDNCGSYQDYHCNGRIVKHHCLICAVDGAMLTLLIMACAGAY